MSLDDLRKRIFRKDEKFTGRFEEPQLGRHSEDVQSFWAPERGESAGDLKNKRISKQILLWGILGIFFLAALSFAVYFVVFGGRGGNDTLAKLDVRVEGGEEISSGGKALWKVKYRNSNSVRLERVTITFQYPETAQPLVGEFSKSGLRRELRDVGIVEPGAEGEEIFSALVFGSKDQVLPGKATIEYRSQDSSARLAKDISYNSKIISTLLGADLEVPDLLQAGQEAEVTMRVVSNADTVYRGLSVEADFPPAFEYVSANPPPSRGQNIWSVGDLASGKEFTIKIRGKIKADTQEQTFHMLVGLYDRIENTLTPFNSIEKSFNVSEPLLAVSLETKSGEIAQNVVAAGSRITMILNWKNNLPVAVHNAVIELEVSGNGIDLKTLEGESGDFQAGTNSLKWVGGRVPELANIEPGASGSFGINYAVSRDIQVRSSADKNFTIRFVATIKTNEVPQGFEGVDVSGRVEKEERIVTRPTFSQKGYYFDTQISNSGPFPPRVGRETTFVVVWSLVNNFNDIDGVSVRATLPGYMRWAGVTLPAGAPITFDQATRELIWSPGTIAAGTGFIRPAREVEFQVGLTPSAPHVGEYPELVSDAVLRAHDTFTNRDFNITEQSVTTDIKFDPKAMRMDKKVQP